LVLFLGKRQATQDLRLRVTVIFGVFIRGKAFDRTTLFRIGSTALATFEAIAYGD
jgi:hypothetical protein